MSTQNPYPLLRPYYKGHDLEQDEKLALRLFRGTAAGNKKTGRAHHRYLSGDEERQAFAALRRVLSYSCTDMNTPLLMALTCSLDPDSSGLERRLVFKFRKKGKPQNAIADLQIFLRVDSYIRSGEKTETAVARTMAEFKLARKTVFEAVKQVKKEIEI